VSKEIGCAIIRGCREEVIDGETGYIVKPGDVGELKIAIEKLIIQPELRKIMGEKGRERALEIYDERIYLERYLDVYLDAAKVVI